MTKLAILKLSYGSFEQGFSVTLQIGQDGARPSTEVMGKLPPNPELPGVYQQWQLAYRGLGLRSRLSAPGEQVKNVSLNQDCGQTAQQLRDRLNVWLQAESFRRIREKWLEKLQPADPIRVLIQTEDPALQKLPWHLWDLLELYPRAEIALSAPAYDQIARISTPTANVAVLAILGNSQGIDTQTDRALLEQLPNAEVRLLVEPSRQEVSDRLWEHPWNILFFAGHSSSQGNTEAGRIYINQTDSLTISQLKFALKKALERDLKLAIFNSCDGLGLARELADLHIPQVIVMREPVPDQVAQTFLKYFLQAFSSGEPLYTAVRQARERLQALEDQFPCATWLPVICQNPAELPPTWAELSGVCDPQPESNLQSPTSPSAPLPTPLPLLAARPPAPSRPHWSIAIAASLLATLLVTTIRYLGLLQSVELQAFDQLMRLRPEEATDPRLLVVTINDNDLKTQSRARGSLSDRVFHQLLTKLDRYQPRAIGLDIYRDYPVDAGQQALAKRLKQDKRLIGVCKVSDPDANVGGVAPPPEVSGDRLGFSNFLEDSDGVLRRQLLFMDLPPDSPCAAPYALSVQLAARYLAAQGIQPSFSQNRDLQFGKTVFHSLVPRTAGYQGIDAWGSQILLNYRATRRPVTQIGLQEFLTGQINPSAVNDRIVLIGVTAWSFGDYWTTPFGAAEKMPGVIAQAQMTSQILSAVLDGRSPIWVWNQWVEIAWIGGWALASGLVCWWFYQRNPTGSRFCLPVVLPAVGLSTALTLTCYGILTQAGWVPLVPPVLAMATTTGAIALYQNRQTYGQPQNGQPSNPTNPTGKPSL